MTTGDKKKEKRNRQREGTHSTNENATVNRIHGPWVEAQSGTCHIPVYDGQGKPNRFHGNRVYDRFGHSLPMWLYTHTCTFGHTFIRSLARANARARLYMCDDLDPFFFRNFLPAEAEGALRACFFGCDSVRPQGAFMFVVVLVDSHTILTTPLQL